MKKNLFIILSSFLIVSCIFTNEKSFCLIKNEMDYPVTIINLDGYVDYSVSEVIAVNQTKKFVSESSSIGEGLVIKLTVNSKTYTASTRYIQDYAGVSITLNNSLQFSVYDGNGNFIQDGTFVEYSDL